MGNFFEALYDVLFQPNIAMRNAAEGRKMGQALAVVLLSSLLPIWAVYFGLKTAGMQQAVSIIVVMHIIGSLAMWIVGSAVWHLIAELLGGKGTAAGLFTALGFAHLPRIFIVPLWVLAALMPAGIRPLIMTVTGFAIAFWVLYLDVAALRGSHELSGTRAVLVMLAPAVAVAAAVIILFATAGTAFMRMPGLM